MTMKLLSLLLLITTSTSTLAQEYQCTLSAPLELDDGVTLEQVKNNAAGTYTVRLAYTGGQSWVGIGVNTEGDSGMVPGNAVIGRVEEDGSTSVIKYSMTSDAKDGSGVLPMANQNLVEASFEQTETESVLTYTQLLTDDGVAINAVGLADNEWEGKHKIHGSFYLPLTENCVTVTQSPTTANPTTTSPTNAPTTAAPTGTTPTTSAPTFTSQPANSIPNYQVQLAEPEGEDQSNGTSATTVITPTTTIAASSTTTAATTSSSTSAASTGGLVKRNDATKDTHSLWRAHGWTLALAWGVFAPLAIGAGVLRHTVGQFANWYQLHFYLNLLVVALTLVGFSLAVAATNKEGKPHFEKQDDTIHQQAGLAIFIVVVLQSAFGYLRPAAPAPPKVKVLPPLSKDDTGSLAKEDRSEDPTELGDNKNLQSSSPAKTVQTSSEEEEEREGAVEAAAQAEEEEVVADKPSAGPSTALMIRKAWEIQHRFTGAAVLGLAWYNCHTGYQLMQDNYDESENHTNIFWGVTGAIAGIIFFLAYVVKMN